MRSFTTQTPNSPPRLSQAPLWQTQQDFFVQQGVEAWRGHLIPNYVTSNSFIAHAYAQIVLAFEERGKK